MMIKYNLILFLLISSIYHIVGGEKNSTLKFPNNFLFGVSTSAYQIEGGNADIYGKGENWWDYNIKKNSYIITDRSNADIACDSFHKYRNDIELLKFLGVKFYRFSISWSRILPNGHSNKINMQGINYYNDLINSLLRNGIEPMITMYHRDLPQSLQELGGWANPYLAYYFEDYARILFTYFGDRVKYWITFNSWCHGYGDNTDPPFLNQPDIAHYLCQNVLLLAHAKVYHLYDQVFRQRQRGMVGITLEKAWIEPLTNSTEDLEAAERARQFTFGIAANPIFHPDGDYPEIVKKRVLEHSKKQGYLRSRLPELSKEEVEFVQGTYDFLGLNYYTTFLVENNNSSTDDLGINKYQKEDWQKSASSWLKGYPVGLRKILNWIKNSYDNPDVFITENGFSDHGQLNDTERIYYLKKHLEEVLKAIHEDKVSVRGYAVWSLLDNFEWMQGYSEKFGLFHVDFKDPNRPRTTKLSSKWYKKVISAKTPEVVDYL
ncbi:hypothetical protein WA026_002834 [Henosepilachna vigintioctopunctata]|uniref:beta-glucosidase n=1 Tax=Henosepilachna vigintioctopunctata TaxID=420089 RepID=A0AAW1U3G8_9CUCU